MAMMERSYSQQQALEIAPKVSAVMSLLGSLFIATDILRSRQKLSHTYCRILLAMSLLDLSSSSALFLTTWPIPADLEEGGSVIYNVGTTQSCSAQGFFIQLGLGIPLYNCSLSFYYLMVIAFSANNQKIHKMEWLLHGVPIVYSITTAVAGLPLTLYNGTNQRFCWISSLPANCGDDGPGSECIRGEGAKFYQWTFFFIPAWLCILTVSFNMGVVACKARATERASSRHLFPGHSSSSSIFSPPQGSGTEENQTTLWQHCCCWWRCCRTQQQPSAGERETLASQVAWQAFFYVAAFYLPFLGFILVMRRTDIPYAFLLLHACTFPLQGFLNCMVYVRPRYLKYRQEHPDGRARSCCAAVYHAYKHTLQTSWCCCASSTATDEDSGDDLRILDPCYRYLQATSTHHHDTPVAVAQSLQDPNKHDEHNNEDQGKDKNTQTADTVDRPIDDSTNQMNLSETQNSSTTFLGLDSATRPPVSGTEEAPAPWS